LKVEAKENKEKHSKIELSREISKYGGPWGLEELENAQNTLEKTEFRKAILIQIKFHKSVLRSKGRKELFQETCQKRKYSDAEIVNNLKEILEQNDINDIDTEEIKPGLFYRDLDESRSQINVKKNELTETLFKAREKRKLDQQKKTLPEYIENPNKLVGRNIQHKCVENGSEMWFNAKVLSVKQVNKDTIKTEYNVQYEEDKDSIWFFPLLIDLKKGDLMIM